MTREDVVSGFNGFKVVFARRTPTTPAMAVATPAKVFITIDGVPKGTQVLRNGTVYGFAPKIEVDYGTQAVQFVLQAPGFDPAPLDVIPDATKSVTAKLKAKSSHQVHEQTPNRDDLDDPFKKKKRTRD